METIQRLPRVGFVESFRPGQFDRVRDVARDLQETGVGLLRIMIPWSGAGMRNGAWYDWLFPELAKRFEFVPCFSIARTSPRTAAKTVTLRNEAVDYAGFLDEMIQRYGRFFEWIEVREGVARRCVSPGGAHPSRAEVMQDMTSAALRSRQLGKKILIGGIRPGYGESSLKEEFESGLMDLAGAVGLQGFPAFHGRRWRGWELLVREICEEIRSGGSDAEVWIAETGASTWRYDEYGQWREFSTVLSAGCSRVFWLSMYDREPESSERNGPGDERERHFGLKSADGREKILYRLLKNGGVESVTDRPYLRRGFPSVAHRTYSLIMGGAGFIGTNLARELMRRGRDVLVFDNLSRTGVENNLKWLDDNSGGRLGIRIADVRDEREVRESVRFADEVFDLCAQVAVTTSLRDPLHDCDVNVRGTLNVLEAVRKWGGAVPLVFTSTNKVYGDLGDLSFVPKDTRYEPEDPELRLNGVSENRPLDFHSPYGCSKGSADQYVLDYGRSFGLRTAVFRMSCIYGPHQFGNEDQGWVAHFMISLIENRPVIIYGDGKQVRDILYIEDLVDALLLAEESIDLISGNAFNMGGGPENAVSLLEVLEIAEMCTGTKPKVAFGEWRQGDQRYYVSDTRKFRNATGWRPRHRVGEGIEKLLQWLRERRDVVLDIQADSEKAVTV